MRPRCASSSWTRGRWSCRSGWPRRTAIRISSSAHDASASLGHRFSRPAWRAAVAGAPWIDAGLLLARGGRAMQRHELLERYEALGEEQDYLEAKPQYEQALAEAPNARLLLEYGSSRRTSAPSTAPPFYSNAKDASRRPPRPGSRSSSGTVS